MAQTARIIVLIGQSNASGRVAYSNLPSTYQGWQYGVKIYNAPLELMSCTVNNNQYALSTGSLNMYGVEAFFKDYSSYLGEDVYIFKVTWGGSAMANVGGSNNWNVSGSAGNWYNELRSAMTSIKTWFTDRGRTYQFEQVIWMQGEEDATTLSWANAYGTNFEAFFTDLQPRWNSTSGGYQPVWIIPPLSPNIDRPGTVDYFMEVRNEMIAYAATVPTKIKIVDTSDATFSDGLHYDASFTRTLYDRIQAQIIANPAP